MKKVYYLIAILCILNIGDYFTTILALGNGAVESNAIARHFVNSGNLHWFKLIGIGLLSIYLIWRAKTSEKSQLRITKLLKWANIGYGIIVAINSITLLSLRGWYYFGFY